MPPRKTEDRQGQGPGIVTKAGGFAANSRLHQAGGAAVRHGTEPDATASALAVTGVTRSHRPSQLKPRGLPAQRSAAASHCASGGRRWRSGQHQRHRKAAAQTQAGNRVSRGSLRSNASARRRSHAIGSMVRTQARKRTGPPLRRNGGWRREWDSNPRTVARRWFSRPVQSTALPSLLSIGA